MKDYSSIDKILPSLRKEYKLSALNESSCALSPFEQFAKWFELSLKIKSGRRNTMTLATVSGRGKPSARTVLLKGFDSSGFTFYTNYQSRKGKELSKTPFACLVFYWPELEKQVIVTGRVSKTSPKNSDLYFQSRPRNSQLAAIASKQSATIGGRAELEEQVHKLKVKFEGKPICRPDHWGGYRLKPENFEFWQGRADRLNDRIQYVKRGKRWKRERLQP